jgi:hypothetical protein
MKEPVLPMNDIKTIGPIGHILGPIGPIQTPIIIKMRRLPFASRLPKARPVVRDF